MNQEQIKQKIEDLRKAWLEAATASERALLSARGKALKYALEIKQQREGLL